MEGSRPVGHLMRDEILAIRHGVHMGKRQAMQQDEGPSTPQQSKRLSRHCRSHQVSREQTRPPQGAATRRRPGRRGAAAAHTRTGPRGEARGAPLGWGPAQPGRAVRPAGAAGTGAPAGTAAAPPRRPARALSGLSQSASHTRRTRRQRGRAPPRPVRGVTWSIANGCKLVMRRGNAHAVASGPRRLGRAHTHTQPGAGAHETHMRLRLLRLLRRLRLHLPSPLRFERSSQTSLLLETKKTLKFVACRRISATRRESRERRARLRAYGGRRGAEEGEEEGLAAEACRLACGRRRGACARPCGRAATLVCVRANSFHFTPACARAGASPPRVPAPMRARRTRAHFTRAHRMMPSTRPSAWRR